MTILTQRKPRFILLPLSAAVMACALLAPIPAFADNALVPGGDLEKDGDGDSWPDGWGKVNGTGTWEKEDANRFIRLTSSQPGETVMMYHEVQIPEGTKAIEITWKERVTGLEKGENPWFDARIMLEFADAERSKIGGSPKAPNNGKDTKGWVKRSTKFDVPEGAVYLKFMPTLFQVQSGTFDIDDIVIQSAN